jgi:coenzyme F420-0:L-glutamate ligase/coenzyme F420-1:gamma-L-glutamate ligase
MSVPVPPSRPAADAVGLRILPVHGIGEVRPGDDLAALLTAGLDRSGIRLRDGDVLCVSTKIVSKALDLLVPKEEKQARIEDATVHLVSRRRGTRVVTSVVQIPSGPVMAAAGIDGSNVPEGMVLLLPEDPDAQAEALRSALAAVSGARIGVVLTDTSSRIWRVGVGDIALGAAGITALQDLRGSADATGRTLSVTVRDLADELASAADLVKGKAEGVPVAVLRGVPDAVVDPAEAVPAAALSRPGQDDWFRRPSLESVWEAIGLGPDEEPIPSVLVEQDAVRVTRAVEVALRAEALLHPDDGEAPSVATEPAPSARTSPSDPPPQDDPATPVQVLVRASADTGRAWARAGALAERIRVALGAESIARPVGPVHLRVLAPLESARDR